MDGYTIWNWSWKYIFLYWDKWKNSVDWHLANSLNEKKINKIFYVYYIPLFIWRDKKKAKSINYSVNTVLLTHQD